MTVPLVLADVRLADGAAVDIALADGRIASITPAGQGAAVGERIACAGGLASISFVEGHIHLDKTLLGLPLIPHVPGASVADRIRNEKKLRGELTLPVEARGGRLIEQIVGFGTGVVRTHVDIDTELGLSGLESLLRLKQSYADLVDIQIVAFPQSGILRDPGVADLLDAALGAGADLIGGLDPAGIDGDIGGHLDVVFGLAQKHGVGVDIHLHDPGPLGAFELRDIAARTRAAGLERRVAVSHAYALGAIDDFEFGRTTAALAQAGVAIMTNAPGAGAMPPVLRAAAAGVIVFAGSDNIRDAWWPYGNGDMLDRARIIGYRQGFYTNEHIAHAFAMTTSLAASVLFPDATGSDVRALAPGAPADLVILASPDTATAVLDCPLTRLVVKRGRVVARDGMLLGR